MFQERKLGPREIGITKGWKRAKYDLPRPIDKTKTSYDLPSLYFPKKSSTLNTTIFRERKLGPRDIGRTKDWKPAKYDIPKDIIDPRIIHKPRIQKPKPIVFAERKLGPRDYGRPEGWKPPPKEWARTLFLSSLDANPDKSRSRPKREKHKRSHSVQITSSTLDQLDFAQKIKRNSSKRSKSVQLNLATVQSLSPREELIEDTEPEIQRKKPMPRPQLAGLFSSEEDLTQDYQNSEDPADRPSRVAFRDTPEVLSPVETQLTSEMSEDFEEYAEHDFADENVDEKTLMTTEEF